jgi:excisionase family DNA binding protein
MSIIKIPKAADELGVSYKTIYNWISSGKLSMPRPGYVVLEEARDVWLNQKLKRIEISFFLAQGTIRDAYGRFIQMDSKKAK